MQGLEEYGSKSIIFHNSVSFLYTFLVLRTRHFYNNNFTDKKKKTLGGKVSNKISCNLRLQLYSISFYWM